MKPIHIVLVVVISFFQALTAQARSGKKQSQIETWSTESVPVPEFLDANEAPLRLESPDHQKILHVEPKTTLSRSSTTRHEVETVPDYYVENNGVRIRGKIEPLAIPEAMWAPDSSALAITSSDGGLTGIWTVQVYRLNGNRFTRVNVIAKVRKDLARTYPPCVSPDPETGYSPCAGDEKELQGTSWWVNVVAIKWMSGSQQLLLLAEVPPVGYYGVNAGRMKGYLVDVPSGRIVTSYTQAAFMKQWGRYLGWKP